MALPLFVYGTLLPGCGGLEHIAINLGSLGAATAGGRLWLTPAHEDPTKVVPGFVPGPEGIVHGHLYEVNQPDWPALDAWEEYRPDVRSSHYRREELITSQGDLAWVYVINTGPLLEIVESGSWVQYCSESGSRPLLLSP
jgi:gamma-glutamylcyclotransferase (GGCT)/AIG2-like uncharacterized protein YtfP